MGKDKDKEKDKDKGNKKKEHQTPVPPSSTTSATQNTPAEPSANTPDAGKFDLNDPKLPKWIEETAMRSGGYAYDKRMKKEEYQAQLLALQIEMTKLQASNIKNQKRIVAIFEGRDGSGKGTSIKAISENINPRNTRIVALSKPTETERGQLYFQRYIVHLPTTGEMVLFDRSWYNRAGVERVMGFCTEDQLATFLRDAPEFENIIVHEGIRFFKFYLTIGRAMQLQRFHERRHDPLKQWKISDVDLAAISKYDAYTAAAAEMFRFTSTPTAPWSVIRANDQRRARLEALRAILLGIDYEGRDLDAIGKPDPLIIGSGPEYFATA